MFEGINADDAGGLLICFQLQALDGKTQEGAGRTKGGYRGAGNILVPHKLWPCGMAEGIAVPGRGVPVFEANMKLDQVYEVGKAIAQPGAFGFP